MIISTIKCKNEIKTAKTDKNGIAKILTINLFNKMELYGKLNGVEPVKFGRSQHTGKDWQAQRFELRATYNGKENILPLSAWGNTVEQLKGLQIGDLIKCYCELRGEEYNGKRYVTIECSFVERVQI